MVFLNCHFLEEVLYNELTEYVKLAADAAAAPNDVCQFSTFETRYIGQHSRFYPCKHQTEMIFSRFCKTNARFAVRKIHSQQK